LKWFHNKSFLIKIVNDTPDDGSDSKEVDVIEEVKGHFERHKYIYIGVGVATLVGATWLITRRNAASYFIPSTNGGLKAAQLPPIVINNTNHVSVNLGGYMRKIVSCVETGEMWPSVKAAAEATGNSVSYMSQHLNGHTGPLQGLHYVIEGIGTAG
jgi:hypothetical protein